jgi:hypothetical protein
MSKSGHGRRLFRRVLSHGSVTYSIEQEIRTGFCAACIPNSSSPETLLLRLGGCNGSEAVPFFWLLCEMERQAYIRPDIILFVSRGAARVRACVVIAVENGDGGGQNAARASRSWASPPSSSSLFAPSSARLAGKQEKRIAMWASDLLKRVKGMGRAS